MAELLDLYEDEDAQCAYAAFLKLKNQFPTLSKLPRQARCIGQCCNEIRCLAKKARETKMNGKEILNEVKMIYDKHKIENVHNDIIGDKSFENSDVHSVFCNADIIETFEEKKQDALQQICQTCDNHFEQLSNQLLKQRLFRDGLNCLLTVYQIIQFSKQLDNNNETLMKIMNQIDKIYNENIRPALEILYNFKKEKFEIAALQLNNAIISLEREKEIAQDLLKNSKIEGLKSAGFSAQSAINGISNIFSVINLYNATNNNVLLGISALIGIVQSGASVYGLSVAMGHFKNWKQLTQLIEEIDKWLKDIDIALDIIKQFKTNKNVLTQDMEIKLIKLQCNEDERLAYILNEQEKQRIQQIQDDAELAKQLSKE